MTSPSAPRSRFNTNAWNRARYSLWAPAYNLVVRGFRSWRKRSIEQLRLQPGERVLIVGAGTGEDLDSLPRDARVVATDLTPAMLEKLKHRAARLGLNLEARVMDGQQLEFPDGTFDVVILHLILAVIPDPIRCARESARVLRPDGRVAILDKFIPDGSSAPWWLRLLAPAAVCFGTELTRQLGPLLDASGLTVTRLESIGWRGYFKIVTASKGPVNPQGRF